MLPYLVSYYGNPHSRTHAYGWETEAAIEKARKVSAEFIHAKFATKIIRIFHVPYFFCYKMCFSLLNSQNTT